MKKFPLQLSLQLSLVVALFVTSAVSAFAQDGSGAVSYRFDNFDLKSGVRATLGCLLMLKSIETGQPCTFTS